MEANIFRGSIKKRWIFQTKITKKYQIIYHFQDKVFFLAFENSSIWSRRWKNSVCLSVWKTKRWLCRVSEMSDIIRRISFTRLDVKVCRNSSIWSFVLFLCWYLYIHWPKSFAAKFKCALTPDRLVYLQSHNFTTRNLIFKNDSSTKISYFKKNSTTII